MSVLRGWQRGHVVASESLRRFPERRLGGNRRDETENKPAPRRLGSGHRAGRAGLHGCSWLRRLRRARRRRRASSRTALVAATGSGTCCASAAEPKCGSPRHPVWSIPHSAASSLSWVGFPKTLCLARCEPQDVCSLPAYPNPPLKAALTAQGFAGTPHSQPSAPLVLRGLFCYGRAQC